MQKKLKARILSLALSAAMVTTMMPTTVFATEGGNIAPGASTLGEIQSFDKLDSRFDPSTGKDAPSHVYGLAVDLDTPEEDLNLPTELTAMVARTTVVSAPAEDETLPDADTTIPDEDEVTGEDVDDTVSGNQPATSSNATEDVTEEIKGEEVPLAPEPEQEQDEETVTTVEQETIPVTWSSDKEYVSDEKGQFIYTAEISEDYILADGVELPQIYVSVGRHTRAATSVAKIGDQSYTTLQAAFDAVTDGQTIQILAAINLGDAGVTLDKDNASVKLDLNGKTITYSGSSSGKAITLTAGSLEIMDSAGSGGGTISATAEYGAAILNSGTGTVTVSGGTVSTTGNYASAIYNESTGSVTISGGTVSATAGNAIANADTGSVTVSCGSVSATTGRAIANANTGLITISQAEGKTTSVTSANTNNTQGTIYLGAGATIDTVLNITGGTVSNTAELEDSSKGYSVCNTADGIMTIDEDATVGRIYPEPKVAEIVDGAKYTTLQEAFTAAVSSDTINLLADIDLGDAGVTFDKSNGNIKLDLKGKTITYSGDSNSSAITLSAGSLEIKDSVTGGKISATTGRAISNNGTVTVSGGTVSATADNGYAIENYSTSSVTISGGEVSATTGKAINNISTGSVTISGGTVSATTGYAINNASTGLILISQGSGKTTTVTSANTGTTDGTIYLGAGATTDTVLTITGGTVSNTANPTEGYSVYNKAAGKMDISSAATVGRIYPEPASGGEQDAFLSSLLMNGRPISGFEPNKPEDVISVTVDGTVKSVNFTPTARLASSTITVNGVPVQSGQASQKIGDLPKDGGFKLITIAVTSGETNITKTYTVNVIRFSNTVATLNNLQISQGTLTPAFSIGNDAYTATVKESVTSMTVTPTATDDVDATITVNGKHVTSGSESEAIALNQGSNTISIVVKAEDTKVTKTYTITVTRKSPLPMEDTPEIEVGAELTNFVPDTLYRINGKPAQPDSSGTLPIKADWHGSTIAIVKMGTPGTTVDSNPQLLYVPPEGLTLLSNLTTSAGSLTPTFDPSTLSYTMEVDLDVDAITMTPTTEVADTTITVNGVAVTSGTTSGDIWLEHGKNVVAITIQKNDATRIMSYVVVVHKAAAPSIGGGGGGGGGGGSSATWISTPPSYQGGTKLIGNVRVPDYTLEGIWKKNENGTWSFFTDKAGQNQITGWAPVFNPYAIVPKGQSAFDWFMFDANGNMLTGWYTDADGSTYYLNPNSDNTLGAMKTGWVLIDGKYYYFNEMPDGTRGKLFKNTRTPDGYLVDENGIWDGSDKQL